MNRIFDIIRRHGVWGLFMMVCGRLPLFGWLAYRRAIHSKTVYLGEYLCARQGVKKRQHHLAVLVRELAREQVPNILEVGSWAGGSAIAMGRALERHCPSGRIFCVDLWEPFYDETSVVAFNGDRHRHFLKSGKIFDLFKHNISAAGLSEKVSYCKTAFRDWVANRKFNLIFIDADHRYEAVSHDLEKANELLSIGGYLCGDDLERQYSEVDKAFCDRHLGDDFVYEKNVAKAHFHPGVTKAVYEFFGGEVSSYDGLWVMKKIGAKKYVPVVPLSVRPSTKGGKVAVIQSAQALLFGKVDDF